MHSHSLDQWTHDHVFLGPKHDRNERRTWFVVALTAVMMVGEIERVGFRGWWAVCPGFWGTIIAVSADTALSRSAGSSRTMTVETTWKNLIASMLAGSNAVAVQVGPCRLQSAQYPSGIRMIVAETA
jgi:hypothetical protein